MNGGIRRDGDSGDDVRFWRGDSEFQFHGPADVVDGVGDEFVVEDVVVDGVAYATADDADGEGEGCDCGDQVLEIGGVSYLQARGALMVS